MKFPAYYAETSERIAMAKGKAEKQTTNDDDSTLDRTLDSAALASFLISVFMRSPQGALKDEKEEVQGIVEPAPGQR